jgi:N6-L-threonylcarbamoyladenine synthase
MANSKSRTILAIETSCDETAAAVLVGDPLARHAKFKILSSVVNSQIKLHKKFGGVVPEVAARAHVKNTPIIVAEALRRAGVALDNIDHIAVTTGPGLIVSLVVGTEYAKALGMAGGKTLIPVNHMAGHLYSVFAADAGAVKFPLLALVVSGGHTMLMVVRDETHYKVIGRTVDDAAGEAFDKVARLLGLPYPGGPVLSKLAEGVRGSIAFPRPMIHTKNYDFSFSGLKTAVLYHRNRLPKKISGAQRADLAASFQDAVCDVLVTKALRAAQEYECKTISLSGGVAANKKLRTDLARTAAAEKLQFIVPAFELCTDNAAMIAVAAYYQLRGGYKPVPFSKVRADSTWELH